MIIPRVFGAELANSVSRPDRRPQWSEDDLKAALADQGGDALELSTRLLDHYRDRVKYFYFGEGRRPSVTGVFETPGGRVQPFTLTAEDPPTLAANFDWTRAFGDEARRLFVGEVAAIPGSGVDKEAVLAANLAKRPTLRFADLTDRVAAVEAFIAALDRLLNSVRGPL